MPFYDPGNTSQTDKFKIFQTVLTDVLKEKGFCVQIILRNAIYNFLLLSITSKHIKFYQMFQL